MIVSFMTFTVTRTLVKIVNSTGGMEVSFGISMQLATGSVGL